MIVYEDVAMEEAQMISYYKKMKGLPYSILLNNLSKEKEQLQLNDWLFFELLQNTINDLYAGQSELKKTLTAWFLLSESGFDTRLTYHTQRAYLYVFSEETIYESPVIEDNGRLFVNLNSLFNQEGSRKQRLRMLNFKPRPNGRSFSFDLSLLPVFPSPSIENKTLSFSWKGEEISLDVQVDGNLKELMADYPLVDESQYLEIPFSNALRTTLLPQLQETLEGKSERESLEILAAFTRSAFIYQEDHEQFGSNKPMAAEEVFLYPYSDCEDRVALYYQLVRELLDLPVIVIAWPDHLSLAVATTHPLGNQTIQLDGTQYFVCDPTGPSNSTEVGNPPAEFASLPFEVIWRN
jgi:hypothetical protein